MKQLKIDNSAVMPCRHQKNELEDGLYQVSQYGICAGFEIKNGRVIVCAPILRRRLAYWMKQAKKVENEEKTDLRKTMHT
jgi:hypothetical protein